MANARGTRSIALALLAACTTNGPATPLPATPLPSTPLPSTPLPSTPLPEAAAAPACPTPATGAITTAHLQGRWRVRSSTGRPGEGHVFHERLGEVLTIEGEILRLEGHAVDAKGGPITSPITKRIELIACTDPPAITLTQTPDAKGWSRNGVLGLMNNVLTLSLDFPQEPAPTDLAAIDDGREVVVLERL